MGAGIVVAGYLYRHPGWVTTAAGVGGRALDLAWRVETAPVRAAVSRRRLGGGHGQVGDLVDPYAVVSGATTSVSAPVSTS